MMSGGMYMSGGGVIFMLIAMAVFVFAFWRIYEKAGYAGAWGLLAAIPFMQFFLLIFLAFADWPVTRRKEER